jgi:predicted nucleic acid-binding protein
MILFDTSVLIERENLDLDPTQAYGASIFSRAELEFGAAKATGGKAERRRARLAKLDEEFEWLPFDEGTTRAYGAVAAAVHKHAPAQARRTDTYIAAQAYQYGVKLMTLNPADFQHVRSMIEVILPPGSE